MIYLLDVNALVALGLAQHVFHARVAHWVQSPAFPKLATCSITEIGFVRVLSQAPVYGFAVMQARALLLRLKKEQASRVAFIADDHDVSSLPIWVKTPRQITDGHLAELASAHGAILATLDENIAGSYVIPE
jgi:predicted nucleic acid-binding protein